MAPQRVAIVTRGPAFHRSPAPGALRLPGLQM